MYDIFFPRDSLHVSACNEKRNSERDREQNEGKKRAALYLSLTSSLILLFLVLLESLRHRVQLYAIGALEQAHTRARLHTLVPAGANNPSRRTKVRGVMTYEGRVYCAQHIFVYNAIT